MTLTAFGVIEYSETKILILIVCVCLFMLFYERIDEMMDDIAEKIKERFKK